MLKVSSDIRAAKRRLKGVQRRQIPFAASLALNDTAFEVRKYIVNRIYPNAFPKAKNKRFPSVAFRVQKATKRRLMSAVFDRLNRYFLDNHITGRDKRPFTGEHLAVPVNARRLASGRIRKQDTIAGGGDTFVADRTGRGPAVWRRNKRGRLSMLYVLKDSTPVRARFDFYRLGMNKAKTVWPRSFDRAIKKALATAR